MAVLDDFIHRYGDSIYATIARERRDELKKQELAKLSPPAQPAAPSASLPQPAMPLPGHEGSDTGARGAWLGVRFEPVTDTIAAQFRMARPRGAFIVRVMDDGPAKPAGLHPGDVILKIDGKDIQEISDLRRVMAEIPVGKEVDVLIVRAGREEIHKVKAAPPPASAAMPVTPAGPGTGPGPGAQFVGPRGQPPPFWWRRTWRRDR